MAFAQVKRLGSEVRGVLDEFFGGLSIQWSVEISHRGECIECVVIDR